MDASSKRPMMAAIGCAIILTVGLGSTSLLNAIAVLLVEGMNTDLVTYAFGPMLATIFAFLGSLVGTKLIDRITPKRCLLIGSVCTAIALTLFAMATGPVMWYIGNVINGIVLAIGAHASAAGVLSRFYGERTPTVFGVVVGVMSFIIAGLVFIESLLLQVFDYRTIIYGYAVIVLVLGVFSNVVLIGKVPAMPAGAPVPEVADDPAELGGGSRRHGRPAPPAPGGITLKEAMRTPALYLFFAAMVFASFPLNGFSAYSSNFLASSGLDASFVVTLLSVFALLVAVVSLVAGKVSEKLGASISSIIVFAGFAAGIALLVMWLSSLSDGMLYGGLVLCALIGPVQILPALFIPQLFGMKDYTAINAVGMGAFYLGGTAVFLIAAAIMQNIGFGMGFIVLAVSGVVACVLFLFAIAASPVRKMMKK
ncbi:MFS transporter [Ellagibacter isourolithinifaciens]|uniref:MFS transporter n=1 Tax=Ellagibacter isourolithinifaciens TaxID=2137581 RepID=UPI003AF1D17F